MASSATAAKKPVSMFTVVAASASGTAFEWYDFFLFVPLANEIAKMFFAGLDDTSAYIFALGAFAVGFAFRPLGALIFGRIGDRIGRKSTFLVTMSLMGLSTFRRRPAAVLRPGRHRRADDVRGSAGAAGPGAGRRVGRGGDLHGRARRQGQARCHRRLARRLGGVRPGRRLAGGAGRPRPDRRAFRGLGLAPAVPVLAGAAGDLDVDPAEAAREPDVPEAEGRGHAVGAPLRGILRQWKNLKTVFIALFAILFAQGSVWYAVFFYAQTFMERTLKADPATVSAVILAGVAVSVPAYVFFGWLSDRIGRKIVMAFGMALFLAALFPGFHMLTEAANPALAKASRAAQVTVVADPADCSFQFDPVGKTQFRSSCDIAKSSLAAAGVSYLNQAAPAGAAAKVMIGQAAVPSVNGRGLDPKALAALKAGFTKTLKSALADAGYPAAADPAQTSPVQDDAGAAGVRDRRLRPLRPAGRLPGRTVPDPHPLHGDVAALSHRHRWVGGFLPTTAFAIVAATGDIYAGLWYPFIFTAIALVSTLLFLPETKDRSLED